MAQEERKEGKVLLQNTLKLALFAKFTYIIPIKPFSIRSDSIINLKKDLTTHSKFLLLKSPLR